MAAEDENIFIIPKDTSSLGKPTDSVKGLNREISISIAPEARNIPTAIISPIRDGRIPATVLSPSLAPSVKAE